MKKAFLDLSRNAEEVQLAYAQAALAIDFIIAKAGHEGVRRVMKRMAASKERGASEAIQEVLGLRFDEFENQWKEYLASKGLIEVSGVHVHRYKIKEGRADEERLDTGIARSGEDVIWVSVTAAPRPLEGYGLMICCQDIRRRKLAETELVGAYRQASDARARLEAALEALPVGLVIEDAAGGIVQANPAYEHIWGAGRPDTRSFEDNRKYRAGWLDTSREVLPHEWVSARAHLRGETVVG